MRGGRLELASQLGHPRVREAGGEDPRLSDTSPPLGFCCNCRLPTISAKAVLLRFRLLSAISYGEFVELRGVFSYQTVSPHIAFDTDLYVQIRTRFVPAMFAQTQRRRVLFYRGSFGMFALYADHDSFPQLKRKRYAGIQLSSKERN